MANIPNSQLVEIRRLASLLLQVINNAEICVSKLRNGFIEQIDTYETRKTIERLQVEILQIDIDADEALNGDLPITNPAEKAQEQTGSLPP